MALEHSRTVQTIFPYISMVVIALLVACCMLELSLIIIYVVTQRSGNTTRLVVQCDQGALKDKTDIVPIDRFQPTQINILD